MRNVVLFVIVTLVTTRAIANICSNDVAGRSIFVCRNASLEDLLYIPRYIYRIEFILSDIRNLPENTFAEFSELKSLSMINCSIENVQSFAFRGLSNLKILNLSKNALTVIRDNVFSGLSSLEKLDLTSNFIEAIKDSSFANISRIRSLDLRHNNLTRINAAILQPLSSASTLDLRYNNLRCVSLQIFNSTKVKWIYIGDNPWDAKCWSELTRYLYNRGIYYGKNLAFDTLTEDRISWNISRQDEGSGILSEEQAEEEANIVREAEGWKEFYETIVQQIADEHRRLDDIDIADKQSGERSSNQNNEENEADEEEEEEEESGLIQFGRNIVLWILSVCKIFQFNFSSS